ncbi:hypothetical protein L9F63_020358, partial [Diploptera punctata]
SATAPTAEESMNKIREVPLFLFKNLFYFPKSYLYTKFVCLLYLRAVSDEH